MRKSSTKDTNEVRVAESRTEIVGTPSERVTGFPFKKSATPFKVFEIYPWGRDDNITPKLMAYCKLPARGYAAA